MKSGRGRRRQLRDIIGMVYRVEGGRENTPNIEKECVKFSCTPRAFTMQGDKKMFDDLQLFLIGPKLLNVINSSIFTSMAE